MTMHGQNHVKFRRPYLGTYRSEGLDSYKFFCTVRCAWIILGAAVQILFA